jgi:DAACS family dicarboxylate/amino acid:cation (Na+ or H+) symporter
MSDVPSSPASEATPAPDQPPRRGLALHWYILIGVIVGAVAGISANALSVQPDGTVHPDLKWYADNLAYPVGQVFLRLIFMVVLPLVFCALVLGVVQVGDVRRLGRMGLTTLLFTVLLASLSVVIGLTLANLIQPGKLPAEKRDALRAQFGGEDPAGKDKDGKGKDAKGKDGKETDKKDGKDKDGKETEKKDDKDTDDKKAAAKIAEQAKKAKPVRDIILDIIPKNPFQEAVGALDGSSPGGGMLAVMFFALMVGVAITLTPARTGPLVSVLEGAYDVTMVVIGMAMRLAPIGVAALVFSLTAVLGVDILRTLFWYVVTVIGGLALHMFGVYAIVLVLFARTNPWWFFGRASDAMLTAFGTSSSNATLPTALYVGENKLGLRPEVSRFVLTVGSTANQNGTALFEGITVLFLAQVFGYDLSFDQQIRVVLMSILAGIGTAGVPGGSLPLIAMVLVSVGIPAEGIGIILGVDRLLDMCRTTVNVTGDLVVAACVNRGQGGAAAGTDEMPGVQA